MKRKYIILIAVIFIVLVIFTTVIINIIVLLPKSLNVSFNDTFPDVSIYTSEGSEIKLTSIKKGNIVIFYLSNSCSGCIEELPIIKRIKDVFSSENTNVILLWEDNIPLKKIANNEFGKDDNYSLKNKVKLSNIKPAMLIIDKNNLITFMSSNIETSINKVFNICNKSGLLNSAINTITKDSNDELDLNSGNKLFFFGIEGCEGCKEYLQKAEEWCKNNNTRIYEYTGYLPDGLNQNIDYYKIYKKVFNIDIYPSLIFIDNRKQMVKVNDIEMLNKLKVNTD